MKSLRAQPQTPRAAVPKGVPAARSAGSVRIIGGTWRSRLIQFPVIEGLRPTGDRVRETLFNWLGQDLSGKTCIDLFAGSGALGFEAASRGATRVLLCETDRAALAALRAAQHYLQATQIEVRQANALSLLHGSNVTEQFDVVFADPPFAADAAATVLAGATRLLKPHGWLYVEQPKMLEEVHPWRLFRHLKAGGVHAHLFQRESS